MKVQQFLTKRIWRRFHRIPVVRLPDWVLEAFKVAVKYERTHISTEGR